MCFKYFVFILLSVYLNLAFGNIDGKEYCVDQSSDNNQPEIITQLENKMKALFLMWKTETNRKLESIEIMIPDLEQNINRKLFSLRNNILDKLEEYVDSKLSNLERNIPEKIKQYVNCNSDFVDNKTVDKIEGNVNFKLDVLAKNISNILEGNNNCKSEAVKKITDLQDKMNRQLEVLDKKIPTNFEENIKFQFDALANNIWKDLDENINCKFHALKNLTDFECKKLPLDENSPVNKIPEKPKLPCKEESVSNNGVTPLYSLYNETLNPYVAVKRNSTGHLTYWEVHFAAQTEGYLGIQLYDKEDISGIRIIIWVAWDTNPYSSVDYNGHRELDIHSPDMLSSTEFRTFYFKLENGNLQFGKKGDRPVISYYSADLGLLNYYRFFSSHGAQIRHCPAS